MECNKKCQKKVKLKETQLKDTTGKKHPQEI